MKQEILNLIRDDGFAASFQSMGQYRQRVLEIIGGMEGAAQAEKPVENTLSRATIAALSKCCYAMPSSFVTDCRLIIGFKTQGDLANAHLALALLRNEGMRHE